MQTPNRTIGNNNISIILLKLSLIRIMCEFSTALCAQRYLSFEHTQTEIIIIHAVVN